MSEDEVTGVSGNTITVVDGSDISVGDTFTTSGGTTFPVITTTTIGDGLVFGGNSLTTGGLNAEEQKELTALQEERERNKKHAKLKKLKSYPAHIREEIVKVIQVREATKSINSAEAEKTPREVELETKKAIRNMVRIDDGIADSIYFPPNIADLSYEEIAKAHAEQILEEEISK